MGKKKRNLIFIFVIFGLFPLVFASVAASAYPERPITLIVNHTPGSGSDLSVRALADRAAKMLGQPIIVTNKAGAGGVVALTSLAAAQPDGYTIGITTQSQLGTNPHVVEFPFDALKAYDHIMAYGKWEYGVCVKADSPFKTLKDLVNYAKANPGKIKYGTSGTATPNNYFMVYLGKAEGIKWEEVVFKGIVEASTAVMGGHLDVVASSGSIVVPYIQGNRLRLLASASRERWKWFPEVPTFKELGYNYQLDIYFGISTPKEVPKPILDKLRDVFKKALDDPEFAKTMDRMYVNIEYRSADEYQALIEATDKDSQKMLLDLGIHKSQKKTK